MKLMSAVCSVGLMFTLIPLVVVKAGITKHVFLSSDRHHVNVRCNAHGAIAIYFLHRGGAGAGTAVDIYLGCDPPVS